MPWLPFFKLGTLMMGRLDFVMTLDGKDMSFYVIKRSPFDQEAVMKGAGYIGPPPFVFPAIDIAAFIGGDVKIAQGKMPIILQIGESVGFWTAKNTPALFENMIEYYGWYWTIDPYSGKSIWSDYDKGAFPTPIAFYDQVVAPGYKYPTAGSAIIGEWGCGLAWGSKEPFNCTQFLGGKAPKQLRVVTVNVPPPPPVVAWKVPFIVADVTADYKNSAAWPGTVLNTIKSAPAPVVKMDEPKAGKTPWKQLTFGSQAGVEMLAVRFGFDPGITQVSSKKGAPLDDVFPLNVHPVYFSVEGLFDV